MLTILLITLISLASYSYLRKPSKFWTINKTYNIQIDGKWLTFENEIYPSNHQYRPYFDMLVTTSIMYALAGFFSLYVQEYYLSYFSFVTWISSSLYHVHGEQLFFNFDNIFATTLLLNYIWSLISAYHFLVDSVHLTIASVGLPLALFLLVYCGMPGTITMLRDCLKCRRCQPEIYRPIHSLWHIATGLGICTAAWHFYQSRLENERVIVSTSMGCSQCSLFFVGKSVLGSTCYFDEKLNFPVVPCLTFVMSFGLNLLGNYNEVMPLD
jgi:hypothetical protein